MENEDVHFVQDQSVSKWGKTNKIKDSSREIEKDAPKSENVKKLADMGEFKEAWERVGRLE